MRKISRIGATVIGMALGASLVAGSVAAWAAPGKPAAATAPTYQQAVDALATAQAYLAANAPATPTPSPTTPTPTTPATTPPSTHASGLPWSDGVWAEHSAAEASAFATWRGRPIDNVMAFTGRETWANQLSNWWTSAVPASFVPARDDFILSVPLWTDDGDAGTDAQWKQLATEAAAVDANGYIRLGWEFNCCFSLATNPATWKTQFSRAATDIKAAAPGLRIVWNPNEGASIGGTAADPTSLYVPGKVDVIGIDAYDWFPAYTTDASAQTHFTKQYGWNYWYSFAQSKGLPFAVPEFGLYDTGDGGAADDPNYVTEVYNWLSAKATAKPGSIAFVSWFNADYCGCNLTDPTTTNPTSGARYKAVIASLAH